MNTETSAIINMLKEDSSENTLLIGYGKLKNLKNKDKYAKKLLAETCFLLAAISKEKKLRASYAKEAIEIYDELKIDKLTDATPILWWLLPDQMHEGVVKSRILEA
ncbi:MAG: hypothetical protein WCE94_10455 [Candidatus Methanoperedens sp.]